MPVYINVFWKQVSSITNSDKGDKEVRVKVKCLLNYEIIIFIKDALNNFLLTLLFRLESSIGCCFSAFHKRNTQIMHFVFQFHSIFEKISL